MQEPSFKLRRLASSRVVLFALGLLLVGGCDRGGRARGADGAVRSALSEVRDRLGQGQAAEAEAALRQLDPGTRDSIPGSLLLGKALLLQGRSAEAASVLRRACSKDSKTRTNSQDRNNSQDKADSQDPEVPWLLAQAERDQGNTRAAAQALKEAVRRAPSRAGLRLELGATLLTLGQTMQAAQTLRQAVLLEPRSARAHQELGRALVAARRYPEALGALVMAQTLGQREEPRVLMMLALAFEGMNRSRAAAEARARAETLDPTLRGLQAPAVLGLDPAILTRSPTPITPDAGAARGPDLGEVQDIEAALAQAQGLLKTGRLREAAAGFRRVVVARPDDARALVGLGTILVQQGQASHALGLFIKALSMHPEEVSDIKNIIDKLLKTKKHQEAAVLLVHAGEALASLGSYHEAATAFERALKLIPDDTAALSGLGRALLAQHDAERATGVYRRLVQHRPRDPQALMALGRLHLEQGQIEEAHGLFTRALAANPQLEEAQQALEQLRGKRIQAGQAEATLRQALARAPRNAQAFADLYLHLRRSGKGTEAEAMLRRLLQAPDSDSAQLQALGNILSEQGTLVQAELLLRRALEQRPGDGSLLLDLGTLYSDMGKPAFAEKLLRQALARQPDDAHTQQMLGVVLSDQRKFAEAAPLFARVAAKRPGDIDAQMNLGVSLRELKDYRGAARALAAASALNPGGCDIQAEHAATLALLGDRKRSSDMLASALTCQPQTLEFLERTGALFLRFRLLDGAAQTYALALKKHPRSANVLCGQALLARYRGQAAEERQALAGVAALGDKANESCKAWMAKPRP